MGGVEGGEFVRGRGVVVMVMVMVNDVGLFL